MDRHFRSNNVAPKISLHLNLLDYFLWSWVKEHVHSTTLITVSEIYLRNKIINTSVPVRYTESGGPGNAGGILVVILVPLLFVLCCTALGFVPPSNKTNTSSLCTFVFYIIFTAAYLRLFSRNLI